MLDTDTNTAPGQLDEWLTLMPGETVYTLVRSVARSGMSRRMDVYIMRDNQPVRITHLVAPILGYSRNDAGMLVSGAGMDMGFHVVYSLARKLFGDTHPSHDPGYTLNQRWL